MDLRQRLIVTCIAVPALGATAGAAASSWYDAMPVSGAFGDFSSGGFAIEGLSQLGQEAGDANARVFTRSGRYANMSAAPVPTSDLPRAVVIEPMPGPVYLLGVSLIGFGLVARRRSETVPGLDRI